MATTARSSKVRRKKPLYVQKALGQLSERVQRVGPEHFGIVSIDCGKDDSKFMLADFYGRRLIPPTPLPHRRGHLQAAIDAISQAIGEHDLRDVVVAIERTGEYHRLVQRAMRQRGWETRLVHPFSTRQFRLPADPDNKTDDNDLDGIHRAAVNGFGLVERVLPAEYQQLQLLTRHRRSLVWKMTSVCNQLRETLHAAMPGYAQCFSNLWESSVSLLIARHTGSAQVVRQLGLPGLQGLADQAQQRYRMTTLAKIQAWAEQAPEGHPHSDTLRLILASLDDDRQRKIQEITDLERTCANLLARLPYVLLLSIPGINVVSAADLAAELGPISNYLTANNITGRAGLMPARYQSAGVDHADGPLRRCGNRRLRAALMQIADNLVTCNHYFGARAGLYKLADKDPRWIRVKVAKSFSRIALAMLSQQRLFAHPACQQRHYILEKLLAFHREHDTPMPQVLADLDLATQQLPRSAYAAEAQPLAQRLRENQSRRCKGPQLLGDILPIVLARLGVHQVQSTIEGRDPS
jgi:transposase